MDVLIFVLLLIQLPAVAILLSRLLEGPTRKPPLQPQTVSSESVGTVGIVVPTLDEAHRIRPCLQGLSQQGHEVRQIVVVDSNSQDGTVDIVKERAQFDPRLCLIQDDPLPSGWVGRPWALHNGYAYLSGTPLSEPPVASGSNCSRDARPVEWILGVDADTRPAPGLAASLVAEAEAEGYDLVSLSPQFILKHPGELMLQPALLMTLVYRFGPTGSRSDSSERVMANGQCFLVRRSLLEELDGYTCARRSFCDDVTLARTAAARGFKVGFWDGSTLLKVRMYEGAMETWREWGRSLDLKDAASSGQTWGDVWFLSCVQALPPLVVVAGIVASLFADASPFPTVSLSPASLLFYLNSGLLAIRFALGIAIAPSYDLRDARLSWLFWLSPLADPLAVLRIWKSASEIPTQWRGRVYGEEQGSFFREEGRGKSEDG
ncbi:2'-O-glycosyltransferase CruG [Baaleninema simplex]|uniref:2'-O-glycosyltransferase CruG n=1 Tax=Baaleninema simplex TaxID=2862350 RepID=UPI00034AE62B|nr:glycosyltransferase family 2 protein [Baaleninema simplex]